MSTPNFARVNTSKIFAFGSAKFYTQETIEANDYPQEWLNEYDELQTQFDYECALNNARCELEAKGWMECDESTGDRSYPGTYFAKKTRSIRVAGVDVDICLSAAVVPGYYDGCTFDVDGSCTVYDRDGYTVGEYDVFGSYAVSEDDVTADNWTGNNGWSRIHAHAIFARLRVALDEMICEAEDVFQANSEHRLACVGIFSNGEAIYSDLDTERGRLKAAVA